MSVDTNLHRTFDYQLSSASLRIIDWAPVRPVAASVLQTGPNVRAYTCVDSASPNEAATAAAYARQESAKQEAAQARVNGTEKTAVASGGGGAGINGDDGAARSLADQGPSDPSVADNTSTALMAAPPLYPSEFAVAAPGEDTEDSPQQQQQQQQQREYSESWSGGGADIAAASPSGGLLFPHAVSPAPAAAAPVGQAERTAANSVGLLSNNGSTHNGVSIINTQGPGAGGHSGAATPKTGGSGMSGATPRVCSPASSLASSPPTLVRSKQQLGLAGNMYGFDAVYQNGSFGVLLGLFTGVGYQQTNIAYRREERVVNGGGRTPSAFPSAATAGAGTAAAAAAAAGGSNVASASNSITNRSPSDGNTTMPAGEGSGVGGSVLLACSDGALGVNSNGEASSSGVGGATTAGAGAAAAESPLTQRTRTGPVIAYKNSGGVQLSNALQCFWYWGARRWTGVLNFRFTPLLSGDAILPVCECVLRTGITENSILIDDPVVYLHSFVVLLGRRKRTPDDAQAKASAVSGAASAGTSHHPHPIALDAADRVGEHVTVSVSEHADDAGQPRRLAPVRDDGSHVSRASTRTASSNSSGASGARPSPTAADPNSATTAASLPRQQSSHGASRPPAARADVSHREGRSSSASSVSAATHESAATGSATKEMSWYDWYQQCMMDTSDEWLWNRAASEVVADAARSTTPWWRLRRVKTGVGLSVRYRKPRGINVYWGWSAQLGRGTSLSGHVDVLRRMSCSISSSFGYLDLSVRLRVNLVTLHQTALDAGLCWRPLQHVPEFAVRVATSASGTTLGVEMADLAPRLYTPLVDRLARYRAQRQQHHGEEASDLFAESGQATAAASTATPHAHNMDSTAHASSPQQQQQQQQQQRHDGSDGSREDLVGLLPVTWHYLRGWGSTITYAYSGVAGAIANTWSASTSSASSHTSPSSADAQSKSAADSMRATSPPLPVPPAFASAPPTPSLTPHANLSGVVTPVSRASMHYLRGACTYVADLGWLESMLRASHVNVSMGVTSESGRLSRNWSFFLVLSEK